MGFCLFNNVAVAGCMALAEFAVDRLLIVDFDVHHGNGTQATFWEEPRVGFLSIHRWPFYPGTGDADETGGGPGLGTKPNLPTPLGTPRGLPGRLRRRPGNAGRQDQAATGARRAPASTPTVSTPWATSAWKPRTTSR